MMHSTGGELRRALIENAIQRHIWQHMLVMKPSDQLELIREAVYQEARLYTVGMQTEQEVNRSQ